MKKHWISEIVEAYLAKEPFDIVSTSKMFMPRHLNTAIDFLSYVVHSKLMTLTQVLRVLSSVGICLTGLWMIRLAIMDPEPTSKLLLLIGGGIALTLTGSLTLLRSLGLKWDVAIAQGGTVMELTPNA